MKKNANRRRRATSRKTPRQLAPSRRKRNDPTNAEFDSEAVRQAEYKLYAQEEPKFDVQPDEESETAPRKASRLDGVTAVVEAAFDAATTPAVRRRLQHGQALAAVIIVPTPAWVEAVAKVLRTVFGPRWVMYARDGSNRSGHKSTVGSRQVSAELGRGLCVMGIAANVRLLPGALTSSADITIRIAAPDAKVIRKAIARFAKRAPGPLQDGIAAGLDLDDIVAAFRPGTGPQRIAERLAATASTLRGEVKDERLPNLETAVEYGAARDFALSLKQEVDDYRAHRITWAEFANKGVICHGEAGLGKSTFYRSVGRLCSIPVTITSVSAWFQPSGYLHDVMANLVASFDQAAALANPVSLLVLDEVEAVPSRDGLRRSGSANMDYWSPLLAELLLRCDNGLSSTRRGVVLGAATNFIDAVDPALLRPGRFERVIEIERPNLEGTLSMLRFHVAGSLPDSELPDIAAMMENSTGAEIMALVRDARRIARHAGRPLQAEDLRLAGLRQDTFTQELMWRVCLHEAGHAVAALALPFGIVRHCIVGARTGSANRTLIARDENDAPTRDMIERSAVMSLAGRSAETVVLGACSAGCEGDVALATTDIASLYMTYALADGVIHLSPRNSVLETVRHDYVMRNTVEADLQRLQRRADELIRRYRDAVVAIAQALQARSYLAGDAVRAIFEANKPATPTAADNVEAV